MYIRIPSTSQYFRYHHFSSCPLLPPYCQPPSFSPWTIPMTPSLFPSLFTSKTPPTPSTTTSLLTAARITVLKHWSHHVTSPVKTAGALRDWCTRRKRLPVAMFFPLASAPLDHPSISASQKSPLTSVFFISPLFYTNDLPQGRGSCWNSMSWFHLAIKVDGFRCGLLRSQTACTKQVPSWSIIITLQFYSFR